MVKSSTLSIWIILSLIISLFLASTAQAIWDDSTGVIWVIENQPVQLGDHVVRVIDASIDEGIPFIDIRKKSNVLYRGFIELDKPVEVANEIRVEYLGSSERYAYGRSVKIRIYQWVDGKIINARFPRYLNRDTIYDTWLEVENTGTKEAIFRTELTQDGKYDPASGRFINRDGTTNAILLDMKFPLQDMSIPQGTVDRVEYNSITGNRRQQSLLGDPQVRAGNAVEKTADVVFKLFFKNQLLDEIVIPQVTYGPSPSGYIKDIYLPDIMIKDQLYESQAWVQNGGPGGNNIDTAKLNLQLMTKGFTLGLSSNKLMKTSDLQVSEDLLRKNMVENAEEQWRFTITPNVPPGDYLLEFRFWQNRHDYLFSTYDVYQKRVRVVDNLNKLINGMYVPASVEVGSRIPVGITLNNVGIGQLLNVNLNAPTLLDGPIKRVITVPSDSTTTVPFEVPATVAGSADITVEIYPHKASNAKYNDPYAESGYMIDSIKKTVQVLEAGEEGPSYAPLPPELMPTQPVYTETKETTTEEPETTTKPTAPVITTPVPSVSPIKKEESISGQAITEPKASTTPVAPQYIIPSLPFTIADEPAMVIIGVLLAIILLMALRVVMNHFKRKQNLESHEAMMAHLKKK